MRPLGAGRHRDPSARGDHRGAGSKLAATLLASSSVDSCTVEQGFQCGPQHAGGLVGAEQARADNGAVHQHGELGGELLGPGDVQPPGDGQQAASQRLHVPPRHLAGRVVLLGELGGHVDLGAAAVVRTGQALADLAHVGVQLAGGVVGELLGHAVPVFADGTAPQLQF